MCVCARVYVDWSLKYSERAQVDVSPEIAVQMPRVHTGSPSSLGGPPAWGHSLDGVPTLADSHAMICAAGTAGYVVKHEPTSTEEMLEKQVLSLSP